LRAPLPPSSTLFPYTTLFRSVGTGYRVQQKGSSLEFALGYSHPITFDPPAGITFEVEGNTKISVHGIDKQQVGEVAANIRKLRRSEEHTSELQSRENLVCRLL